MAKKEPATNFPNCCSSRLNEVGPVCQTGPTEGRTVDLLVKLYFKRQEAALLIHVEQEARRDADIAWRLLEYVILDRRESGLPVYPVLVLAGSAGSTPERPLRMEFPDRCVLTFDFPVIDLAKLEAHDYVRKGNAAALALAAKMKFQQEEQEGFILDFVAALGRSPVAKEAAGRAIRYFLAYQQLDEKKALNVEEQMVKPGSAMISEKALDRLNPFFLIWQRRGRQSKGSTLVLRLLRRRLGPLPQARRQMIKKLSLPKIEALGEALLDLDSPDDLTHWLQKNATPFSPCKTAKAKLRSGRR